MKKTITLLEKSFRQLWMKTAVLSAFFMLFGLAASAQYTATTHTYGCQWTNGSNNYDRYSTIESVEIADAQGNVLYSKAGDGCNNRPNGTVVTGGHFSVIESQPAFTLSSGSEYTITVGVDNVLNSSVRTYIGVWIDFNANGSYESSEFVTPTSGININPGTTRSWTFTVPCSVSTDPTRMRVRSNYGNSTAYRWTASQSQSQGYYGETEDFAMDLALATGISSDFFLPDTAFVGTIVQMTNGSQGNITSSWDIDNDGSYDYISANAEHIYTATGTYEVKLRNYNCAGTDSTTKTIEIVNPTAPPVADFVATKNVVELFDVFQLIDLSSNGATYWNWYLTNGTDTIDYLDLGDLQGGDPYVNRNPTIFTGTNPIGFPKLFPDRGLWTVCLQSSNGLGSSAVSCKTDYIEVTKTSFNMGPETSLPANIITAETGTLYDKGGPFNDYTVPEANLEALIAPCGATSVTLEFAQFKLLSNANLKIYDGVNALGTPLHPGDGFTEGNAPTGPITSNSGLLYLLWNSSTGSTDSGFIANWTSVTGSGAAPVANFEIAGNNGAITNDTLVNAVWYDFTNTSENDEGNTSYEWTIDGTNYFSKDLPNQIFLTNGAHTVSLKVTTCDGQTDTKTLGITVVHPGSPTFIDFVADNRRPRVGETVTFSAMSDKANMWEFTIFPNTGVTAEAPISNALDERTFTFSSPGKYTVQCKAYNVVDSTSSENTAIKANYIIVVDHCRPIISVTTSSDVGISRVMLTEESTGTVYENESMTGVDYENFTDLGTIELNFGGTYNFEVDRATNTNPMSRKIWVDWNVDGDFDDAGEEVASQATGTSLTWDGDIIVPNAANAFEANTIMRVGVSYGTDPNEPCGASSGVANANRIGEFEDYSVRVVNDGDDPWITLNGDDTVYVEQGSIYSDLGAMAYDPSQGDITSEIVTTSNVNESLTGIYQVTYCVEDASGNEAPCVTRTVYVVVDQTPPVITLNGAAVDTIEVGSAWTDAGATATDAKDGNLDGAIVVTGSVDVNVLGIYVVTYYVQDAQGNSSEVTRTIYVVDTEAPMITNASAYPDGTNPSIWIVDVQLQNVFVDVTSFSDNYNSIGNNLTVTATPGIGMEASVDTRFKGATAVTYTATDESGNTTVQVIRYVVEDYEPPVIDLHTLDTVWHEVNTNYNPVNATASDNLYNTTQISLTMTSNVNPFVLGTYQDTYTATDASGNIATRTRYVKVVDTEAPQISGKNGSIVRVGLYSTFAAEERLVYSDNYDSPDDVRANAELIYTDINTYEEGLYTATFRTYDNSGNESDPFTLYVVVSRSELQVGIDELSLEDLMSVSPNPTTGLFTIRVDLPENEEISVDIYNAMGQKVSEVVSGSISRGAYDVDLSGNANGFYYVKMQVRGTVVTKKVMLNQ